MRTIYLDGQYRDVSTQIIEAFTPGVFKAKGVFETMLALDTTVLDTSLHLNRLRCGLKTLGIKIPLINASVLKEVLRRNGLEAARVRLMVWQAPPTAGQPRAQTHVMAAALPYKASNRKTYRVCLVKTSREANDRLSDVKSLDYELFARAYERAQAEGFDEALLLNRHGHIFEASRANIFWIKDKVLYTPPLTSGCLNGITRQQVIRHAVNMRISVKEKDLAPAILESCDAAFLTNSLIGIKPIEPAMIRNISIN